MWPITSAAACNSSGTFRAACSRTPPWSGERAAYRDGVERPRIDVVLATGIAPELCARINLGYLDPATVNPDDYRDREAEGILYVDHAGETLHLVGD